MYQLKILALKKHYFKSPSLGMYLGSVVIYSNFVMGET